MKTIKNKELIIVKVTKDELLSDKWIPFRILSKKVSEIEMKQNIYGNLLRNKLYNSVSGGKYNTKMFAGIKCINIENPMAKEEASLMLKFELVGGENA